MLCPCDFGTQPAQRLEGIAAGVQGRTLSAGFVRAGKLPGFCTKLFRTTTNDIRTINELESDAVTPGDKLILLKQTDGIL